MSASAAPNDGPKKRIVVYTAVAKGYDILKNPARLSEACDYVCFSDHVQLSAPAWSQRPFDEHVDDPVRTAKKPKIMPHLYFPEYEYSIWVDANVVVLGEVTELVERYLRDSSIAMFAHPQGRTCVYEEAEACIELGKDETDIIRRQVERYRKLGHPENSGLHTCTIIVRRHRDPAIIDAMEEWWREIQAHSRRDQISFNYVATKNHLRVNTIAGNLWASDNPHFRIIPHASKPCFCAKLYWAPADEPLSKERCVMRFPPLGGNQHRLSFDLPIGAAVHRMRFDPADRPGYLRMASVRLVEKDAQSQEVSTIWSLDDAHEIAREARLEELVFCTSVLGDTFLATTNDPRLMLDLPQPVEPAAGHFLSLEVEMTWPMSADYVIAHTTFVSALEQSRNVRATLEHQLQEANAREAELETRLQQVQTSHASLENRMHRQEGSTKELEKTLSTIYGSRAWRLLTRWRRLKYRILPPPSSSANRLSHQDNDSEP